MLNFSTVMTANPSESSAHGSFLRAAPWILTCIANRKSFLLPGANRDVLCLMFSPFSPFYLAGGGPETGFRKLLVCA